MFLLFMPVGCADEATALPLMATTATAATASAGSDFLMLDLPFCFFGKTGRFRVVHSV
jgi:hypothetical protein